MPRPPLRTSSRREKPPPPRIQDTGKTRSAKRSGSDHTRGSSSGSDSGSSNVRHHMGQRNSGWTRKGRNGNRIESQIETRGSLARSGGKKSGGDGESKHSDPTAVPAKEEKRLGETPSATPNAVLSTVPKDDGPAKDASQDHGQEGGHVHKKKFPSRGSSLRKTQATKFRSMRKIMKYSEKCVVPSACLEPAKRVCPENFDDRFSNKEEGKSTESEYRTLSESDSVKQKLWSAKQNEAPSEDNRGQFVPSVNVGGSMAERSGPTSEEGQGGEAEATPGAHPSPKLEKDTAIEEAEHIGKRPSMRSLVAAGVSRKRSHSTKKVNKGMLRCNSNFSHVTARRSSGRRNCGKNAAGEAMRNAEAAKELGNGNEPTRSTVGSSHGNSVDILSEKLPRSAMLQRKKLKIKRRMEKIQAPSTDQKRRMAMLSRNGSLRKVAEEGKKRDEIFEDVRDEKEEEALKGVLELMTRNQAERRIAEMSQTSERDTAQHDEPVTDSIPNADISEGKGPSKDGELRKPEPIPVDVSKEKPSTLYRSDFDVLTDCAFNNNASYVQGEEKGRGIPVSVEEKAASGFAVQKEGEKKAGEAVRAEKRSAFRNRKRFLRSASFPKSRKRSRARIGGTNMNSENSSFRQSVLVSESETETEADVSGSKRGPSYALPSPPSADRRMQRKRKADVPTDVRDSMDNSDDETESLTLGLDNDQKSEKEGAAHVRHPSPHVDATRKNLFTLGVPFVTSTPIQISGVTVSKVSTLESECVDNSPQNSKAKDSVNSDNSQMQDARHIAWHPKFEADWPFSQPHLSIDLTKLNILQPLPFEKKLNLKLKIDELLNSKVLKSMWKPLMAEAASPLTSVPIRSSHSHFDSPFAFPSPQVTGKSHCVICMEMKNGNATNVQACSHDRPPLIPPSTVCTIPSTACSSSCTPCILPPSHASDAMGPPSSIAINVPVSDSTPVPSFLSPITLASSLANAGRTNSGRGKWSKSSGTPFILPRPAFMSHYYKNPHPQTASTSLLPLAKPRRRRQRTTTVVKRLGHIPLRVRSPSAANHGSSNEANAGREEWNTVSSLQPMTHPDVIPQAENSTLNASQQPVAQAPPPSSLKVTANPIQIIYKQNNTSLRMSSFPLPPFLPISSLVDTPERSKRGKLKKFSFGGAILEEKTSISDLRVEQEPRGDDFTLMLSSERRQLPELHFAVLTNEPTDKGILPPRKNDALEVVSLPDSAPEEAGPNAHEESRMGNPPSFSTFDQSKDEDRPELFPFFKVDSLSESFPIDGVRRHDNGGARSDDGGDVAFVQSKGSGMGVSEPLVHGVSTDVDVDVDAVVGRRESMKKGAEKVANGLNPASNSPERTRSTRMRRIKSGGRKWSKKGWNVLDMKAQTLLPPASTSGLDDVSLSSSLPWAFQEMGKPAHADAGNSTAVEIDFLNETRKELAPDSCDKSPIVQSSGKETPLRFSHPELASESAEQGDHAFEFRRPRIPEQEKANESLFHPLTPSSPHPIASGFPPPSSPSIPSNHADSPIGIENQGKEFCIRRGSEDGNHGETESCDAPPVGSKPVLLMGKVLSGESKEVPPAFPISSNSDRVDAPSSSLTSGEEKEKRSDSGFLRTRSVPSDRSNDNLYSQLFPPSEKSTGWNFLLGKAKEASPSASDATTKSNAADNRMKKSLYERHLISNEGRITRIRKFPCRMRSDHQLSSSASSQPATKSGSQGFLPPASSTSASASLSPFPALSSPASYFPLKTAEKESVQSKMVGLLSSPLSSSSTPLLTSSTSHRPSFPFSASSSLSSSSILSYDRPSFLPFSSASLLSSATTGTLSPPHSSTPPSLSPLPFSSPPGNAEPKLPHSPASSFSFLQNASGVKNLRKDSDFMSSEFLNEKSKNRSFLNSFDPDLLNASSRNGSKALKSSRNSVPNPKSKRPSSLESPFALPSTSPSSPIAGPPPQSASVVPSSTSASNDSLSLPSWMKESFRNKEDRRKAEIHLEKYKSLILENPTNPRHLDERGSGMKPVAQMEDGEISELHTASKFNSMFGFLNADASKDGGRKGEAERAAERSRSRRGNSRKKKNSMPLPQTNLGDKDSKVEINFFDRGPSDPRSEPMEPSNTSERPNLDREGATMIKTVNSDPPVGFIDFL